MNRLPLTLVVALIFVPHAYGAEPAPGDACTAVNNLLFSAGPEVPAGGGYALLCQGGTWKPILSFDSAAGVTKIGNQTCATNEILKFNGTKWACAADATGGAPTWASITGVPAGFADGIDDVGSSVWLDGGSGKLYYSSGNVGIGTNNPSTLLDVSGGHVTIRGPDTAYKGLELINSTNSKRWQIMMRTTADGALNADKLMIHHHNGIGWGLHTTFDVSGNVGIGTTSPTQKLDVVGTVKATAFVGDGSGLTGLPSGADNLGNHTATANLNMQANQIQMSNSGTNRLYFEPQSGFYRAAFDRLTFWDHGAGADIAELNDSVGGTGVAGLALKRPSWNALMMDGNASTKSLVMHYGGDADNQLRFGKYADNFGGWEANVALLDIDNGNFWTGGSVTAASFAGNGAGLTGVPGDNLGNHTATAALNMSGNVITDSADLMQRDSNGNNGKWSAIINWDDTLHFQRRAAGGGWEGNMAWLNLTSGDFVAAGSLTAGTSLSVQGAITDPSVGTLRDADGGWVRTYGNTGWYNNTYGGGWHMSDTSWLRSYGDKNIFTGSVVRADAGFQVDGNAIIDGNGAITSPGDIVANGGTTGSNYSNNSIAIHAENGGAGYGSRLRFGGSGTNASIFQIQGTSDNVKLTINGSNVGIGSVTAPSHILHIPGQGRATNSAWATSSDRRVKEDIRVIEGGLETIDKLRPVTFRYTEEYQDGNPNLAGIRRGFIAQEVEAVVPDMVTKAEEKFGDKTISDFRVLGNSDFVPLLVSAVKELKATNDNQAAEIIRQAKRIEALRKDMELLRAEPRAAQ